MCGEVPIPLLLLPHTSDWGEGGGRVPKIVSLLLFQLQTVTDERTEEEEEEKVPGEKREKEGGGGDPIALSQSCCRPISTEEEEEEEENETRSICLPSLLFLPPLLPFRLLRWEFYSGAASAAGFLLDQRGCVEEAKRIFVMRERTRACNAFSHIQG